MISRPLPELGGYEPKANAPMTLEPLARVLFMEANKVLNRRASAKRARWAAYIGRPFRLSPSDPRPDPGTIENDAGLIDG